MKAVRFPLAVALAALASSAVGCVSHGMVFDFNGRMIEVGGVREVRISRGLEVTSFDGRTMKVNGREAINLNGKDLTVNGSNVTHGSSQHVVNPQQKLVIKGGKPVIVDRNSKKDWWAFWR